MYEDVISAVTDSISCPLPFDIISQIDAKVGPFLKGGLLQSEVADAFFDRETVSPILLPDALAAAISVLLAQHIPVKVHGHNVFAILCGALLAYAEGGGREDTLRYVQRRKETSVIAYTAIAVEKRMGQANNWHSRKKGYILWLMDELAKSATEMEVAISYFLAGYHIRGAWWRNKSSEEWAKKNHLVTYSVRMDASLRDAFIDTCRKQELSQSEVISEWIRAFVSKERKGQKAENGPS